MLKAKTDADRLVLAALDELCGAGDLPATSAGTRTAQLARAIEAVAAGQKADGLGRWRNFTAVSSATLALEDDLLSTRRALRRAHNANAAMLAQQDQQQ